MGHRSHGQEQGWPLKFYSPMSCGGKLGAVTGMRCLAAEDTTRKSGVAGTGSTTETTTTPSWWWTSSGRRRGAIRCLSVSRSVSRHSRTKTNAHATDTARSIGGGRLAGLACRRRRPRQCERGRRWRCRRVPCILCVRRFLGKQQSKRTKIIKTITEPESRSESVQSNRSVRGGGDGRTV